MTATTLTDLEIIDVYYEDDDDPEAENGVVIVIRDDRIEDNNRFRQLYGQTITITVTS